jgi:ParB family chromosome partitioning protein
METTTTNATGGQNGTGLTDEQLKALVKQGAKAFDPFELTIIDDPAHPLYDVRIKRVPPTEAFIQDIMDLGVHTPVVVHREGNLLVVAAGRRRVMAAREVNRRRAAVDLPPIRVPVALRRGDDKDALDVSISENEHRAGDDLATKAAKAAQMVSMHGADAAAYAHTGKRFGVTATTIRNWVALLQLPAPIRDAVFKGELAMTDGLEIGKLPADEQAAAAEQVKRDNPVLPGGKRRRRMNSAPSRGRLKTILKTTNGEFTPRERLLLSWVTGQATVGEVAQAIPELAGALKIKGK